MMTYFTIWHYLVVAVCILLFALAAFVSIREQSPKIRNSMIFSSFIVLLLVSAFLIMALDKYTKKVELYGLKNTRILRTEQIQYSGYVRNVGNYTIGKVTVELKLVNKGHVTGNVKAGSFYNPSGFMEFFGDGEKKAYKPQKVEETFVVAEDLKPNEAKSFVIRLRYPPYFQHTADFVRVFAH